MYVVRQDMDHYRNTTDRLQTANMESASSKVPVKLVKVTRVLGRTGMFGFVVAGERRWYWEGISERGSLAEL
jgi:hypothetical protein